MSGKITKIKVGEDFYVLSVSGSSRMANQVSEYVKKAAERAREEAKRQMEASEHDDPPEEALAG